MTYGTPKAKLGRKYKDVEAPEGTKTGAVVLSAPVASHSDGGYDAGLVEQEERWADVDEARLQEAE